jgi:hypothetical protein
MMKLACLVCIALGLGSSLAHAGNTDCRAVSTRLLDHLDKGDYIGATADFDGAMKAGLSTDRLAGIWQAMPIKFGAQGMREPERVSQMDGHTVVVTPLHYGKILIDAQVACNADGRIGGFYIKPHH